MGPQDAPIATEGGVSPNSFIDQSFSTLALLTFGAAEFPVMGAVLCIVRWLAASLASTRKMPVACHHPQCGNHKCLQTLPNAPWGATLPLVENHCSRYTLLPFLRNHWSKNLPAIKLARYVCSPWRLQWSSFRKETKSMSKRAPCKEGLGKDVEWALG